MNFAVSSQTAPTSSASDEVLSAVAHEIRQPLGTIESIAYYLSMVLPAEDAKTQSHLLHIQQLVGQANWILASGLRLADTSAAQPMALDLEELITEALSTQGAAADPPPILHLAGERLLVQIDPSHARSLIQDLLSLFQGLTTDLHPAQIRTALGDRCALLEISSAAPGFRTEASLGAGAALGLDAARKIAESNGGSLVCEVDPATGIRVRVMLP